MQRVIWGGLEDIPDYILTQILIRIPPRYLWSVGSVSKRFLRLSRTQAVWVEALKQPIWDFDCSKHLLLGENTDLTHRETLKRILHRLEGLEVLVELIRGSSIKFSKITKRPRHKTKHIPVGMLVHDITASYNKTDNIRTIQFDGEYWNTEREEEIEVPITWSMSYFGNYKWTLQSNNAVWSDIINMSCSRELEPYYTYKNLVNDISDVPAEFKTLYKLASQSKLDMRFLVGVATNGGAQISTIWYALEENRFSCNPYRTLGYYLGGGDPMDQRRFYNSVDNEIADRGQDNRLPNPLCEDFKFSAIVSKKRRLE
jgi:hypothetical protein